MTDSFDPTWPRDAEHPPEDVLLEHVDGELPASAALRVRTHLASCWSCRTRVDRMRAAIVAFVGFYEGPFTDAVQPPDERWGGFGDALRKAAGSPPSPGRRFKSFRLFRRQLTIEPHVSSRRWGSVLALRAAGSACVFGLVALLLWTSAGETRVSASELLRRSEAAQAAQRALVDRPVVHQRLKITRAVRTAGPTASATWDLWHDTTGGRLHERRRARPSDHGLPDEVAGVLRANHRDPRSPLSPASYADWRRSIVAADETLTQSWLSGGARTFRLRTLVREPVADGAITSAELVVRAADWHPVEESIRVTVAGQQREYTLIEEGFEVVRLASVAALFDEPPSPPVAAAAVEPVPADTPTSARPAAPPVPAAPAYTGAVLDQLELDALYQLHRVELCLPEHSRIVRSPAEGLHVEAYVATEAARDFVSQTLRAFGEPAGVHIDVQIAPAADHALRPVLVRDALLRTPFGPPVRAYVAGRLGSAAVVRGADEAIDRAVEQFASWAIDRSGRLGQHARALQALVDRLPQPGLDGLGLDALAAWQSMIGDHARALRREAELLRTGLQPVLFHGLPEVRPDRHPPVQSVAEVGPIVARAREVTNGIEAAMRDGFAVDGSARGLAEGDRVQLLKQLLRAEAIGGAFDVLWTLGR